MKFRMKYEYLCVNKHYPAVVKKIFSEIYNNAKTLLSVVQCAKCLQYKSHVILPNIASRRVIIYLTTSQANYFNPL